MFPVGTDFLRFSGEACSIDEKLSVIEIVEMSTMLLLYALQGVVGGVAVIGVFGGARTGFVVVSKDILSSDAFSNSVLLVPITSIPYVCKLDMNFLVSFEFLDSLGYNFTLLSVSST